MASHEDEAEAEVAIGACSYELKCPICLEEYDNKSFVNVCFHAFCYVCIVQWSEVSNKCPLCKASFKSLIYDVESDSDYKTHIINPPSKKQDSREVSINEARRFRYRTTVLPGERQPHEAQRHRLQQSRKPASEERRKTVYQSGMRALPFTTEGKKVRVRNISASFFKSNPAASHRLLPWLARDIKATLGEEHVEFIVQLILSMIDKIDIDSVEFLDHLRPFFHNKTEHFVHELISFAKSPLDMPAYDNKVSYGLPSQQKKETAPVVEETSERGEPSTPGQAGPSHGDHEENQEREGMGSDNDIHDRLLYELATTTWEESPIIIRQPITPPPPQQQESDPDFYIISSPEISRSEVVSKTDNVQDNEVTCSTGGGEGEEGGKGHHEDSETSEREKSRHSKSSKTRKHRHKKSKRSYHYSSEEGERERRRSSSREWRRERTRSPSAPSHTTDSPYEDYKRRKGTKYSTNEKSRSRSHDHKSCDHKGHSRHHSSSSHDRSRSSHDKSKHHKKSSHDRKSSSKRSYEKSRRGSTSRQKSHDRSHDQRKRYSNYSTSTSEEESKAQQRKLSEDDIKRELQDINDDLLTVKKQLLRHCLHKERTALLKSALQKELGGVDMSLAPHTDNDVPSGIEDLESELMRIERDIEAGKDQVAAVNKRLKENTDNGHSYSSDE